MIYLSKLFDYENQKTFFTPTIFAINKKKSCLDVQGSSLIFH